jgi:hypothetical protein
MADQQPQSFDALVKQAEQLPEVEQLNIRRALQRLIEIASGALRSKQPPQKRP